MPTLGAEKAREEGASPDHPCKSRPMSACTNTRCGGCRRAGGKKCVRRKSAYSHRDHITFMWWGFCSGFFPEKIRSRQFPLSTIIFIHEDEHAMYGTQHITDKSPVFSFFACAMPCEMRFGVKPQAYSKPTASHDSKCTATGIKMSEDIESAPANGARWPNRVCHQSLGT